MEIKRCEKEDEIHIILNVYHDEPCLGDFTDKRMGREALRMDYFYPTIFQNVIKYAHDYYICKIMGHPNRLDEMPLQAELVVEPFHRRALDFVGPINPPSRQKVYILVCIDYMTKWVEDMAFLKSNDRAVIDFLYVYIFTRFGVPMEIAIDGGP